VLLCVLQNPDGSWPLRPISHCRVAWVGAVNAPPTGGGTITSGTGMVEGFDILLLGAVTL
jgi:hypothetical protein